MRARVVPIPETVTLAFAVLNPTPSDADQPVPLPDGSLLRRRGSSAESVQRLPALPHTQLVTRVVSADRLLGASEEALQEARALSSGSDGLVIDLQIPRVVEEVSEAPRPAAQWFAFDYEPDLPDVRTHGLDAIGLPEIVVRGVESQQRTFVDMVVVGLVQRLLTEWPTNDPVGPAAVSLHDIAAGYEGCPGVDAPAGGPLVNVLIDYLESQHILDVELMDDPRAVLTESS